MNTSLIYFLLVLHATIEESNLIADRLGLPHARITDLAQVQDFPMLPPGNKGGFEYRGFWAAIRTANVNFRFCYGEVEVVQLHGPTGVEDWRDNDGQVGVARGSVTEQMAYQQARGWLEKMGVDVRALEEEHQARIEHWTLPLTDVDTVSSRFTVKWFARQSGEEQSAHAAEVGLNASENWLVRLGVRDLRFYHPRLPAIPHDIAINLLPDEPVRQMFGLRPGDPLQRLFTEHGFGYTNAFKLLETPPEYEATARRLLLTESKELLSILECDQLDAPEEGNLTDFYVNPPAFGSGGRLEFTNGEIVFDSNGRLKLFHYLPRGQTNRLLWLARAPNHLTSEEAYQIATQKVAALSIDIERLDRECKRTFFQRQHYRYENKRKVWFYVPEYELHWRSREEPGESSVVRVAAYGDLKRVGDIELDDTSYWTRPPVVVTNRQEFMNTR